MASENKSDCPERLYLERWPEELDRDDTIHYEPTGYGVDMTGSGLTSEITVYVREDLAPDTGAALLRRMWKASRVDSDGVFIPAGDVELEFAQWIREHGDGP